MRPPPAQLRVVFAAVVLLAAVIALAVSSNRHSGKPTGPQPEGDYTALAGSSGPEAFGRRTACGGVLRPETLGVAHPTLPCGARIFIDLHGVRVLTQVVDRGPYELGREFDLTDALARRIGLRGVQQVHWAYARTG